MNKIFVFLCLCVFTVSLADEPKHLTDLHLLLHQMCAEDTSYHHEPIEVKWKGIEGADKCVCRTDCSGLLNALFVYSYNLTDNQILTWFGVPRPQSVHYAAVIRDQNHFKRLFHISEVLPGDVIAIHYLPTAPSPTFDTGHVVVVDDSPLLGESSPPFVENTLQWRVRLIDCSRRGHGKEDSRYVDGVIREGLGSAVFRLYTNLEGKIVGYTMHTGEDSCFYDQTQRPVYVGRFLNDF